MGIHILGGDKLAVMYCSTTDWAFGPVFYSDDEHSAEERALMFLEYLPQDARQYSEYELERMYHEWLNQEKTKWEKKEEVKCRVCNQVKSKHCDFDEPGLDHPANCDLMHHEFKEKKESDDRVSD